MKTLINILLAAVLIGSLIWVMIAPTLVALIPTFIAIAAGLGLVKHNTNWIETF